jgi:hypothetical protein
MRLWNGFIHVWPILEHLIKLALAEATGDNGP